MNGFISKSYDFKAEAMDLFNLFHGEPYLFFLDSSLKHPCYGRYSILGFDPFDLFVSDETDLLSSLKEKFSLFKSERWQEEAPFGAGIAGFLGYDHGLYLENIPLLSQDDLCLPHCVFGFYDCVMTIDHFTGKLIITSSGLPEKKGHYRKLRAMERLKWVEDRIKCYVLNGSDSKESGDGVFAAAEELPLKCNFTKEGYLAALRKALDHIQAGDIYQVNLSQRFALEIGSSGLDPMNIYKSLRSVSPSSFAGYMDCGDFQIISSSPESFLRLNNRQVQTRPMKGTRPRGASKVDDDRLKEEMMASQKEIAELLMITDLERNDLGRVCEYGTVKVRQMRSIEQYQTVFQATSTVEGLLRKDQDCFDLLRACFPGGSVTGCPKIRAMEIIERLEPTRRAMYTGSMGYIDFCGDMDWNILIRTLLATDDQLYFQVGSGIVADSIPEDEYEETLIKARAIRMCLKNEVSKVYRGQPQTSSSR